MKRDVHLFAAALGGALGLTMVNPAIAQKAGGILQLSHFDSPTSMSLHEESTTAALRPMMGVFNNLVVYDQHVAQNSMESIVPDLATARTWREDGKERTVPLPRGVQWHARQPFTAGDLHSTC